MTTSLTELTSSVLGPVLTPGSDDLGLEVAGFNTASQHRPAVVVGATREADVQAAVGYARRHGLGVGVMTTGHGHFLSVDEGGVLITTRRMNSVSIDPARRTATLGAGVRWRQVLDAAAAHGLAPMSGSASSVGAIGYMLGGGLGPLARQHGFAADHVRRVRLVTADGRVLTLDKDENPDLFWAVRGGKGNFGIATEMEIDLLPIDAVFTASVYFGSDSIEDVLAKYAGWANELPHEYTTSIAILRLPDLPELPGMLRGQTVVHLRFIGCADGPVESADQAALAALRPMLDAGRVVLQEIGRRSFADLDSVHADPVEPVPVWQRSGQVAALTPQVVQAVLEAVGPAADCHLAMVEIRQLGGALRKPVHSPNAVAGRSGAFNVLLLGVSSPSTHQLVAAAGSAAHDLLRDHLTGHSLVNWLGGATQPEEVRRAWEPDLLRRLLEIKAQADPGNMFRYGHPLVGGFERVR